ncbi:MAG TPA: glycosyltransferase [Solirubrobacteraceae bacterium]|nr:glycosyltransferase [Solirubrobacteraceae bacterium]
MSRVSVVIPVKDGERYLEELLHALAREGVDEVLVIDSGSRDRSLEIARAAGVQLLRIEPAEFGHGRTRNLGAERTSGELICFLTQDATPVPGWLDAYREAFALDQRVGAAYGPHLPRADTSPMIARELSEFFAGFTTGGAGAHEASGAGAGSAGVGGAGAGGRPVLQRAGDPTFLSNVNACYARACWEEIRFREVPYSEDQAFGSDLLAAGGTKVYHPGAAVLHAHDYGAIEFMRRYFDEYRGLRESTGHVEPFAPLGAARHVAGAVAADRRWMAARNMGAAERARWTARSATHHGGRRVFSALGSRAERVPAPLRRRLSLEGRDDEGSGLAGAAAQGEAGLVSAAAAHSANGSAPGQVAGAPAVGLPELPPTKHLPQVLPHDDYDVVARIWNEGPAPLLEAVPGMAERERLRLALVIPPFSRGSGGHNTLFQIFTRLERRGHACSVWLADYHNQMRDVRAARLRSEIREFFAPFEGPVYKGFEGWQGADVAIATGWQTVHAMLTLDQCRARAYLVNDHEPEFYAASTEQVLAEDTYRYDMHCIAASPWLRDLLIERYGASADAFQLGVDADVYRPLPVQRRTDTVVYYARHSTPRRAVPIGLMALAELHRRRPDVRIVLFGTDEPQHAAFPYEHMGVLSPAQLARLYSQATVGLCLSLTNFSLMPKEMLACGLPCVELAGVSAESIFGADGALDLAPLHPQRIADALERLLADPALRERRSREGREFVASHTWDHATDEVEAGLRHALREREAAAV